MNPTTRELNWEACYNVRDLGGLPTAQGGATRWGAIVRADLLGRLTPSGQQALIDYGVRTIIDLRSPQQASAEPSAFTTATGNADEPIYHNLPVEAYYPHVGQLIRNAQSRAEVYGIVIDHYPANHVAVMRAIIQAPPGGVAIHCHAGKDRTGVIVALLLDLVGVAGELIAEDYAESQIRLWPLYEQIIAKLGDEAQVDFWLKPTATPGMMFALLAHIQQRYGNSRGYLRWAGLSEAELEQLTFKLCH